MESGVDAEIDARRRGVSGSISNRGFLVLVQGVAFEDEHFTKIVFYSAEQGEATQVCLRADTLL